jgi:hypothetical protein
MGCGDAKVETHGHKAWWEMREFMGQDGDGIKQSREVFRNMATGEVHAPEEGWNGEPPAPSGDLAQVRHNSDLYRENYDRIRWD